MRGRQECGLRQVWTSNAHHFSDTRHVSAGQSGGQDDLGLPLQFNCSQEAKVITDRFTRTSVLWGSTVLSVVHAVCASGPVLGEFWSDE